MFSEEQIAWISVTQCPGIGNKRFLELLNMLAKNSLTITDFWKLPEKEVAKLGFSPNILKQFLHHQKTYSVDGLLSSLQKHAARVILLSEPDYPKLLKEISDPPVILYVKGNIELVNTKPIAIVGTRRVTQYGQMVTEKITKDLVESGYSIVSGFMYGVDGIAHRAALKAGGYTLGVLGFGFDYMYPKKHQALAEQVLSKGGALITEYIPTTEPIAGQFPMRNRIVAGLSLGVVVTEAAKESGSKITAQLAGEYGREVFTIAGAITSPYSEGTKDLANSGAKLVTGVSDIIEELEVANSALHSVQISLDNMLKQIEHELDRQILKLLISQSLETDDIVRLVQRSVTEVSTRLSLLELEGRLQQQNGRWIVMSW